MTPYGGVDLLLRSATRSGSLRVLSAGIRREQVWTDGQMLLSLCLLNILGDDCVEDVDRLDADEGLCRQVGRHEARILRMSRRKLKRRHWKGRQRTFPSPCSLLHWLHGNHDDAADRKRPEGEAYVPVPSSTLTPLVEANCWLVAMAVDHAALRKATLDVNATIVPSGRREALFAYRAANGTHQGEKDCHTLNCFLAERGTMLCTEKPDGNLPAREGNVRVLLRSLVLLPDRIRK